MNQNPSLGSVPGTSQAEKVYYSLTAQISDQVSQTLNPPNHQPPADGVQTSTSNPSGEEGPSPGGSGFSPPETWCPSPLSSRSFDSLPFSPPRRTDQAREAESVFDIVYARITVAVTVTLHLT